MARRKSSRKLEPVPMKINFQIPANLTHAYIDISECVSKLSRKFFRQGLNWAVAGGRIILPSASGSAGNAVYLSTLPHTWVVSNAWEKSFRVWDKMNKEYGLEEMPSIKPKFYDFKIYADPMHVNATSAANLQPYNLGPGSTVGPFPSPIVTTNPPLTGEWDYSEIVIPNDAAGGAPSAPAEYSLHMCGNDIASVSKGMIVGYANSRAVPTSPDPTTTTPVSSWMNNLFDDGNQVPEIVTNLQQDNDELPYDQLMYPGGGTNFIELENQVLAYNTNTIGIREQRFTGFSAPCGLIRVDNLYSDSESSTPLIIELELMPGTHRGYLAEPMTEM